MGGGVTRRPASRLQAPVRIGSEKELTGVQMLTTSACDSNTGGGDACIKTDTLRNSVVSSNSAASNDSGMARSGPAPPFKTVSQRALSYTSNIRVTIVVQIDVLP